MCSINVTEVDNTIRRLEEYVSRLKVGQLKNQIFQEGERRRMEYL